MFIISQTPRCDCVLFSRGQLAVNGADALGNASSLVIRGRRSTRGVCLRPCKSSQSKPASQSVSRALTHSLTHYNVTFWWHADAKVVDIGKSS